LPFYRLPAMALGAAQQKGKSLGRTTPPLGHATTQEPLTQMDYVQLTQHSWLSTSLKRRFTGEMDR
jgi:hypothetical protein